MTVLRESRQSSQRRHNANNSTPHCFPRYTRQFLYTQMYRLHDNQSIWALQEPRLFVFGVLEAEKGS